MGRDISLLVGRTMSISGSRPFSILCAIILVIVSNTQVTFAEGNADEAPNHYEIHKKSEVLLPYPRMGRSTDSVQDLLLTLQQQQLQNGDPQSRQQTPEKKLPMPKPRENTESQGPSVPASEYMLPYLRPGRSGSLNDDSDDSDQNYSDEDDDEDEEGDTMIPYPRFGRSFHENGDNNMIPNFRFGRSDDLLPYPRFGRSDKLLPYLRFGRSDKLLPYLRFGRSEKLLPYLRFGRSDTESDSEFQTLTPYPRFGKRDSEILIPYPRFGRRSSGDDILLPYPRIGRSSLPWNPFRNLTPGSSFYFMSYPSQNPADYVHESRNEMVNPVQKYTKRATNKDTLLPSIRLGKRSDLLVPQFRLGKKDAGTAGMILPYPRFGRSEENMTPHLRFGKRDVNDLILPYLRPGRSQEFSKSLKSPSYESDSIIPYPRIGKKSSNGQAEDDQSLLMLPQARFGRSTDKLTAAKETLESLKPIIPGQSVRYANKSNNLFKTVAVRDTLSSHSRSGRSKKTPEINSRKKRSITNNNIVPYPRFGRSEDRLKMLMSKDRPNPKVSEDSHYGSGNQNYMLPYMRPGRSAYFSHLRRNDGENQMVIPYLRMGRSN